MTQQQISNAFWACAPVIFVLFWAGGYSFAKLGLPHIEPMTMLALRFGLAVLCLIPVLVIYRPALPRDAGHWSVMALSGFLIQCVYFGLAYLAMNQGMAAGTAAIIMALQPAIVAALAPLVGERRGRPLMWLGLLLGFVGVSISVLDNTGGNAAPLSAGLLALGALAGICAATLLEKVHGRRTDPVLGGAVQYTVGFCVLTPVALLTETQAIDWHPNLYISLGYLVIANSLISISLYVALVQRGNTTQVSSLLYLVPPLALIIAWALLDEPITAGAIVGFGLCLTGVYIVNRSKPLG